MGLPITAVHKNDIYKMRRVGKAAPRDVPAPVPLANARRISLTPVSFSAALEGAKPVIDEAMRRRVVLGSDGRPQAGEFTVAPAIPIVAITAAGLIDAREQPEAPSRATHLVPGGADHAARESRRSSIRSWSTTTLGPGKRAATRTRQSPALRSTRDGNTPVKDAWSATSTLSRSLSGPRSSSATGKVPARWWFRWTASRDKSSAWAATR